MAITASALRRDFARDWVERHAGSARTTPRRPIINRRPSAMRYEISRDATATDPNRSSGKRLFDVVAASLALLFFAPLFLGVAIAIKVTSPGPVFFRQTRYGCGNRRFKIYKFRTMHQRLGDVTGVRQTTENDPRVTSVGRMLRQTSLDELPQLINVIRGDMSLVGPRPHVPGMRAGGLLYEDLVPYYFQRHTVRPGITGLAQISGCRGSTANVAGSIARIHFDLEYIETWSLPLDAKIIMRTVWREFLSGHGN